MDDFSIKSAEECRFDAVSLGEVMLRIDPGDVPTARAREGRIWHGGGEINVAEGLSYCFGLRARAVTALVDDGIGRNIENQLRESGVDTSKVIWFEPGGGGKFATDKKGTICNGINFTWSGKGVLPSVTEYYRAHSAIGKIESGDFDWEKIFEGGVRWFHTGGIYTLISPTSGQVALDALKAAGDCGTFRSFDLNYRSKVEPDKEKARAQNKEIVRHADFLVGNQDDFYDTLGEETHEGEDNSFEAWLEAYKDMLRRVSGKYPNLKLIGTQLRTALSADRINWGAVLYEVGADRMHVAPTRKNIEIADRTGGGDSFLSGTAAALMKGRPPAEAVQWGAAHGICVQETAGDTSMVKEADVLKELKRASEGGGVSALR